MARVETAAGVPRRVLVVRLGAIGDVVNALAFASALKQHAPATEIGWVVHPLAAPLVTGHPALDRVHVLERGSLRRWLALVGELRRARYDLAVDLQRIAKSALLARASGASRVLGFDRARSKELAWLWTRERIPAGDRGAHMLEQYLEFARHLGVPARAPLRQLPRDPAAEACAARWLEELGGPPLVVNVGATKPANRWPPERFGELARALARELGAPVCLTGGPADREAASRAREAAGPGLLDLVGRTSLPELVALLARARLWIGCDTGPMHIAAACGTPVVALFGAADERRTGPYGPGHRVVRTTPPCAPCNRRRCPLPRHVCMEDLSVEQVLSAARAALHGAGSPTKIAR
jgi:lipopolysaccharide heptosyltransferase II